MKLVNFEQLGAKSEEERKNSVKLLQKHPQKDLKDCIRVASLNTSSLKARVTRPSSQCVYHKCMLPDQSEIRHVNGKIAGAIVGKDLSEIFRDLDL